MVSHTFKTQHCRERPIQSEVPVGGFTSQSNRWFLECIKQMSSANRVFNATRSEDFIADKTGRIDWLLSNAYP
ncbi:hypothetical protein [Aestuariivivens sediminicola]|uniref:hypothetical protein n=1 Tax=Aestuariivivens sediminicola TaxID=2913560 RepID=UPI001F5A2E55|nr:hypothetical protein [Aestuariivivens sediminicola]